MLPPYIMVPVASQDKSRAAKINNYNMKLSSYGKKVAAIIVVVVFCLLSVPCLFDLAYVFHVGQYAYNLVLLTCVLPGAVVLVLNLLGAKL